MLLTLAIITLLLFLTFVVDSGIGSRSVRNLVDLPLPAGDLPSVSVIVPARDEAEKIETALQSVLRLDYPSLEVLVVDDRSSDATPSILARLAAANRRLRVITIESLPAGWLGKNHAMQVAADRATGELLLFTDADIVFEPTVLRRAVGYFAAENLDHLTASPEMPPVSPPIGMFVACFSLFFAIYARPWRARNKSVHDHVGVGAFNLVRADFYRRIGGHEPIRMRPDDDMMLAKLIKKNGGRPAIVIGRGALSVEWYSSVPEAAGGLEKNAFTSVGYSLPLLIAATLFMIAAYLWPFVAIFVTHGAVRVINACTCAIILSVVAAICAKAGLGPPSYALAFPLATILFLLIVWRASLKAFVAGGIRWRDTFYRLEELRANKV
jgi:glycosyltransferase involved in cell wall biosynthesis